MDQLDQQLAAWSHADPPRALVGHSQAPYTDDQLAARGLTFQHDPSAQPGEFYLAGRWEIHQGVTN